MVTSVVSPTTAPSSLTSSTATESSNASASENLTAIDFDNFLQLLTAQLSNQDPLNPLDSADFVAQLASFSSVEQIVGTNSRLDSIAELLSGSGGISEYADWIGREAEIPDTPGYFDGATPMNYRLSGNAEATSVEVVITNDAGGEVARFQAANSAEVQSWDGNINGVVAPAGIYSIQATYSDDTDVVGVETASTFGLVNEVRLSGTQPILSLEGGMSVDPATVTGLSAQS